ncbi:MAG: UDP-N-acetylenolpyruvoylglucosamine reductase, partial [Lachnospiraceae bacterium]|nr:UDP-N-acetylenolpyruvoylglucosamine reductase [Lachnospiraceae bacterium]
TLPAEKLELGYRTSVIPKKGYLVLEAVMSLAEGNMEESKALMDDLAFRRKDKQPLEFPSAGSTFKRPAGHFAGKLIEDCGLKGFTVGGAQVSEKHAGFVINKGGATASDIYNLCKEVEKRVKAEFGVSLEMEVKLLGEFEEE